MTARTVLRLTLIVPSLVFLVLAGILFAGHRRLARLESVWHQELFAGLEPLERFPIRGANEMAIDLEVLAGRAGISFGSEHRPGLEEPAAAAAARWEAAREPLRGYLYELRRAESSLSLDLPAEVDDFLTAALGPLRQARDRQLDLSELPVWQLDLSQGFELPVPNYLAVLDLNRAFLAAALAHLQRGEAVEAERFLQASWRLKDGIAESPVLIAQLIAQAQLTDWLAVRRQIECTSAGWQEPLATADQRSANLYALRLEGWMAVDWMGRDSTAEDLGPVFRYAPRSVRQLTVLHYGEAIERLTARMREADARTFDPEAVFDEEWARIPRWSVISRVLFPNFPDAWLKGVRRDLEVEHLVQVLTLRRALADGVPPAQAAALPPVPSAAVDGLAWSRGEGAGGVLLEIDDPVPPTSVKEPLSLRYLVEPPRCDGT